MSKIFSGAYAVDPLDAVLGIRICGGSSEWVDLQRKRPGRIRG